MLSADDRDAIRQVVALYGHVLDERQWSRMGEVFTDDVVYDASSMSLAVVHSLSELRTWFSADDGQHPLAHHATNVVITEDGAGVVRVDSKGLVVGYGGRCGSLVYRDTFRNTPDGWRIARRDLTLRTAESIPEPS